LNWEAIDYMSQDVFYSRFNPPKEYGHDDEIKGRLPELNARLRCNLMVRRQKKDVLPQLPDKRYEMTYIEPNGAIRDVLAREALIDFDPKMLFNEDFTLDGTPISTLRREMGEAMVPRVVEYIQYMMDVVEHPKLIVFTHHRTVAAELMDRLSKYSPVVHQGGMTTAAKEHAKASFTTNAGTRIFIGQLDTMEGVDGLQRICSDVVFAEPAWTPGRNEQCVDRAHRMGQHGNVVAHFLLVEGSFNEMVLNVVLGKAGDIHESLDDQSFSSTCYGQQATGAWQWLHSA
jgi:SNF2 family DNA or RNA helicase